MTKLEIQDAIFDFIVKSKLELPLKEKKIIIKFQYLMNGEYAKCTTKLGAFEMLNDTHLKLENQEPFELDRIYNIEKIKFETINLF